ncbi:MAG: queuosine precursor transporter [Alphaproteobacteria bacterium]|nr:queuosine precursor transporter [Alphaproteobacteria bacterium]
MSQDDYVADLGVDERKYPLYERIYLLIAASFVVTLVLTNIVGIKLFRAPFNPEFALTTGIITYPLTFLFTDLVSEIYGKKRADFMVLLGFLMSMGMLVITQIAMRVDPHPYWAPPENAGFYPTHLDYQHAFESVFALNGILLFGSMLAYLCAQLIDNWLYHFWKQLTKGRHLWLRNNGSTMISQLFDTAIVNSILFYLGFGMDFWTGVTIMATIYVYKLVIALCDTPLIYLFVYVVKHLLKDELEEPA